MSEEYLIEYGAPTLAGLKTGSLFSCPVEEQENFIQEIRKLNGCLNRKGLWLIPMKLEGKRALLYLFRPEKLKEDLSEDITRKLLLERGYPAEDGKCCVAELIRRVRRGKCFPHEIGLFLGYPPEDVKGFMEQGSRKAKCCVGWQVFGDEEKARKTAALHRKCTECYKRCWENGSSLERLTVSFAG